MLRSATLDEFIEVLRETYTRVPPEAWDDFKDQVEALGKQHGDNVPCRFDYDPKNNTIKVSVAPLARANLN